MCGKCKNCKWWDPTRGRGPQIGRCDKIGTQVSDDPVGGFDVVVSVADDHGLRYDLVTGPEFGCTQFDAK